MVGLSEQVVSGRQVESDAKAMHQRCSELVPRPNSKDFSNCPIPWTKFPYLRASGITEHHFGEAWWILLDSIGR